MTTATITPPAASAHAISRRRLLILVTVLMAQLMLVLDASVVNVALPHIQHDLHLSEARLTWINNAYLITFGGLLLLFGRLGDLLGRRRIFLAGLVIFTLASLACGLSDSATTLIIARFVQGLGAAAASSVVLAIISTEFPEPSERAKAMSGYMFVSVSGGSIGLLVGGVLTEAISWHWIFLINIPIGFLAVAMARALLHETPAPGIGRDLDVGGAVLVTSAAMVGIYGIVEIANHHWTTLPVLSPIIGSVLLFAAFFTLETRLANPLLPPRMFRIKTLMATSAIRGLLISGMYAVFFFGVLHLSYALHWGPLKIGFGFLPMTLMVAVLSRGLSARIVDRLGPRRTLFMGLTIVLASLLVLSQQGAGTHYFPGMFFTFAFMGFGMGNSFLPLLVLSMSDVPPEDAGIGSAIVNLSLQLSAAVSLAILGTVAAHHSASILSDHSAAWAHVHTVDALVRGYQLSYWIGATGVILAIILTAILIRPTSPPAEHTQPEITAPEGV